MKTYCLSFVTFVLIALLSCSANRIVASDEIISYSVSASNVNAIDVSTSIKVLFTQSENVSVKVECPENIADVLNVNVKNGKLTAGFKSNTNIEGNCRVTITVTAPSLESINASSSSSFEMSGSLVQDGDLAIQASSSALVSLYKLSLRNIDIDNSTSSSIDISGVTATKLNIGCSTSARVNINDIRCLNINAEASSAASVTLAGVARTAEYDASSAAAIHARGLKADTVNGAKASSGAIVSCNANSYKGIAKSSGGSVSCK